MRFVKESVLDAPVEAVFAFHEAKDAFSRLLPPWERVEVVQPPASLEVGTVVIARTFVGPLSFTIEAEHVAYEKNRLFEDVMRRGPFRTWHHRHLFSPHPRGCLLRDEIDYELPGGILGKWLGGAVMEARLERLFTYRHAQTREALGC